MLILDSINHGFFLFIHLLDVHELDCPLFLFYLIEMVFLSLSGIVKWWHTAPCITDSVYLFILSVGGGFFFSWLHRKWLGDLFPFRLCPNWRFSISVVSWCFFFFSRLKTVNWVKRLILVVFFGFSAGVVGGVLVVWGSSLCSF